MEQKQVTSQTMELVSTRKTAADRPVPSAGPPESNQMINTEQANAMPVPRPGALKRGLRRGAAALLSALMLAGLPAGPAAADFWGSREVSSFLIAGTTPLPGASLWDVLARSVASAFYTDRAQSLPFAPPASDGGATLFGAYLAYDQFPDLAANPIPPESDLTHYQLPEPAGEGAIAYTIKPQSTAGYEYYQGIFVQNGTGTSTNIEERLKAKLPFSISGATGPQVLILHTHTSEAYGPNPGEEDTRNGDDRTANPEHSVVRVGREVAAVLSAQGISVLHDTTVYDETYTGAYARSLKGVETLLLRYPSIRVVLDIHRDALNNAGEQRYKLVFDHEGESTAQLMLLVGTDKGSLEHPGWEGNYSLALKLQADMLKTNEFLPRPIKLTRSSYHQHVAPGALLLEVGANGNAVGEAVRSGRIFAKSLARILKREAE